MYYYFYYYYYYYWILKGVKLDSMWITCGFYSIPQKCAIFVEIHMESRWNYYSIWNVWGSVQYTEDP